MIEPKVLIYNKLLEIISITVGSTNIPVVVYQERPEILSELDTKAVIEFRVESNVPQYDLSGSSDVQNITMSIGLWGKTSSITTALLLAVEPKLVSINYKLTSCLDVPEPDGYSHVNTQFTY